MPKPIDQRLREQLRAKGTPASEATRVAHARMVQAGNLKSNGGLTEKGKLRSEMGAAGRAKDRAARRSGGDPSDYAYSPRTNTARKRGI